LRHTGLEDKALPVVVLDVLCDFYSLSRLGADPTENTVSNSSTIVVMGVCLAIARKSVSRERVYQAVAQKRTFVCLPIA
jgi:hypothetical protein